MPNLTLFGALSPPLPSRRASTIDPANPARSSESTESTATHRLFDEFLRCSVAQCDNLGSPVGPVPMKEWWRPLKVLKGMPDKLTNFPKIWNDFKGRYPSVQRDENVAPTCTICRLASWKRSSSCAAPAWERGKEKQPTSETIPITQIII